MKAVSQEILKISGLGLQEKFKKKKKSFLYLASQTLEGVRSKKKKGAKEWVSRFYC